MPLNKKLLSFAVALLLALIAGACTGGVFLYRDRFFGASKMEASGALDLTPDDAILQMAHRYAEKKLGSPDSVCVSRWLGKDRRFVYLAFGCAKFTLQYGEWRAYGDQGFRALRLRHFFGAFFFGMDQGDPEDLGQSLRRLYPPAINDLWWRQSSSADFMSAGQAKAKAP